MARDGLISYANSTILAEVYNAAMKKLLIPVFAIATFATGMIYHATASDAQTTAQVTTETPMPTPVASNKPVLTPTPKNTPLVTPGKQAQTATSHNDVTANSTPTPTPSPTETIEPTPEVSTTPQPQVGDNGYNAQGQPDTSVVIAP